MAERQVTLAEMLTRVMDARLADVHIALPGRVQSFNKDDQTADIIPQVWPDGEELPVLPVVPVVYPKGSGGGIVYGLASGDPGLLVFCESDLSQWRQQGEPGAPADTGRHSMQSAVFLPGLVPRGSEDTLPTASTTVVRSGDLRLGDSTAIEPVVKGTSLDTAFSTYDTAFQIWLAAHTTWVNAVGAEVPNLANLPTPPTSPVTIMTTATGTLQAAHIALQTAITNALSATVKVK